MFSHKLVLFAFSHEGAFGLLQSRVHEIWARFYGSSFKDDFTYTPSESFETFPFPNGWISAASLERSGREYYEYRAALMIRNNQGLTKTYNRFHDPNETDTGIVRLRELHDTMDRAALDAYGWTDIRPTCEFLLDYEIDEEDWGSKKKPYRYRWPDDVRDEVLGRLLALNAERVAAEHVIGPTMVPSKAASKKKTKAKALKPSLPIEDV